MRPRKMNTKSNIFWLKGGLLFFLCLLTGLGRVVAAGGGHAFDFQDSSGDTLYLLNDDEARIIATEGLDSMYNFNFSAARKRMGWLKQLHPEHPLPSFLVALSYWWQMLPDMSNTRYDKYFLKYIDESTEQVKLLKRKGLKAEANFVAACAYGLEARYYGERKKWFRAALSSRHVLSAMKEINKRKDLSAELLFGLGLYNYYAIWIKEKYPSIRLLISLFPSGNLDLGLRQLKYASSHAYYVRVEAQIFLMDILKKDSIEASLYWAEYLCNQYPKNPYFQKQYASSLFSANRFSSCKRLCLQINERAKEGYFGYQGNTARWANFYLGWIAFNLDKKYGAAKRYFISVLRYSVEARMPRRAYTLLALDYLGQIERKKGKNQRALLYYKKLVKLSDDKEEELYKKAKSQIRELRRLEKKKKKRRKTKRSKQTSSLYARIDNLVTC